MESFMWTFFLHFDLIIQVNVIVGFIVEEGGKYADEFDHETWQLISWISVIACSEEFQIPWLLNSLYLYGMFYHVSASSQGRSAWGSGSFFHHLQ